MLYRTYPPSNVRDHAREDPRQAPEPSSAEETVRDQVEREFDRGDFDYEFAQYVLDEEGVRGVIDLFDDCGYRIGYRTEGNAIVLRRKNVVQGGSVPPRRTLWDSLPPVVDLALTEIGQLYHSDQRLVEQFCDLEIERRLALGDPCTLAKQAELDREEVGER